MQTFLKALAQKHSDLPEEKTYYRMAEYDLNDDGTPELLVYLSGQGIGGSGGDWLYILEKRDGMYSVIADGILSFTVDIGPKSPGGYRPIYVWQETVLIGITMNCVTKMEDIKINLEQITN